MSTSTREQFHQALVQAAAEVQRPEYFETVKYLFASLGLPTDQLSPLTGTEEVAMLAAAGIIEVKRLRDLIAANEAK